MPRFDLSRRARRDLVEIGEYTAERWDDAQAERYVSALYAACQRVADGAAAGRRRCDHIRPGLWRVGHVSHVLFFRELPGGDVLICRVLHERMLPERHAMEDDEDEDDKE